MKSLDDLKSDMSTLYEEVRAGKTELKTAAELANIAGKYLKAEQLQLAREIFLDGKQRHTAPALPAAKAKQKGMQYHGEGLQGGKVGSVFDLGGASG